MTPYFTLTKCNKLCARARVEAFKELRGWGRGEPKGLGSSQFSSSGLHF